MIRWAMAAPALRGLRKDIALALASRRDDGGRTLYETGKAIGRRSGDIQRIVHGMVSDGLLRPSDPEPTRGTQFSLTEAGHTALERELETELVPGLFVDHQRFLRVVISDERALQAVFAEREFSALLAWVMETGRGDEWLLALRPDLTRRHPVSRLIGALKDSGAECEALLSNSILSADEFRAIGAGLDVNKVRA